MRSVPENIQPPTDLFPQCRWGTERPAALTPSREVSQVSSRSGTGGWQMPVIQALTTLLARASHVQLTPHARCRRDARLPVLRYEVTQDRASNPRKGTHHHSAAQANMGHVRRPGGPWRRWAVVGSPLGRAHGQRAVSPASREMGSGRPERLEGEAGGWGPVLVQTPAREWPGTTGDISLRAAWSGGCRPGKSEAKSPVQELESE